MHPHPKTCIAPIVALTLLVVDLSGQTKGSSPKLLSTEKLEAGAVWLMPALRQAKRLTANTRVTVWFDEQLLGDGAAYRRRSAEWADRKRRELRASAVATLKQLSRRSHARIENGLQKLQQSKLVRDVERHWILNGFSCTVNGKAGLDALIALPGVNKVFRARGGRNAGRRRPAKGKAKFIPEPPASSFDPKRFRHPWYTRLLLADRVWREFGVTGTGTLNIIHDGNFVLEGHAATNLYRNPGEVPGNGVDDDGNGRIDDYHGYNFVTDSANTTMIPGNGQLHGTECAAIICGTGTEQVDIELGLAPTGRWAGVIAGSKLEAAIEWAIEQGADTYSMSFSAPGLGEFRSHWRKVMEHGSICGVYFVSGAGNFARQGSRSYAAVPVQMRTPEDIPEVVFAAAGVQRDLSRTPFSSQGPVEWQLEHYHDGRVQKPEVCAFNSALPTVYPDGQVLEAQISGNSFAGPMFCGSIALMLAADPDLLPWDLKQIITATALDVGPRGVDYQTGHGLINCYRAVKEVLRRRALREGKDASRYTGRVAGDCLDLAAHAKKLSTRILQVSRVRANSLAARAGLRRGDRPIKVAGKAVANQQQFADRMRAATGKTTVAVVVRRGKRELTLQLGRWRQAYRVSEGFTEPVFR